MPLLGDDYTTGDGLTLGVSLVLLEIPDEDWIKQVIISAFNTATLEENWNDDYGAITSQQATNIFSLILQTIQFDYEPPTMMPAGAIMMWNEQIPPNRWLICDGSAAFTAEYPELFALWNYKYGGSGAQFGLPDMRNYSPMGVGGNVLLDDTAGELTHTLITNEIPSHNHDQNIGNVDAYLGTGGTGRTAYGAVTTSSLVRVQTDNNGGGLAHNNLHPVYGTNFIVYGGLP